MDKELADIIRRLRTKAEEKRDMAKAAADAEFQADMQSIERIALLEGKPLANTASIATAPSTKRKGRKDGATAAVREIIGKLGNGFSVAKIAAYIEEHGVKSVGRSAIYSSLNKMVGQGEIERIVSDGEPTNSYKIVELKKAA